MRRIGNQIVDVIWACAAPPMPRSSRSRRFRSWSIEADREAAARYGINVADITNLIQTAIGGAPITQVYVGDRIYNVTRACRQRSGQQACKPIGDLPLTDLPAARRFR
jgi:cobalt-zinc-cadmium resistance protein CzcA